MKAFAIDKYKGNLTQREVPDPVPGPEDVVVAVHATSVNPLDLKIRDGELKLVVPYEMPLVMGNDFAGKVIAVGASARRFKVGDEVYACANKDRIGTFAERIALSEDDLAPKPAGLSMTEAASLPLVALTAWQVLVVRARVKPGQKVLIHAGSGGVGTIAIQLARHLGATVATTAGANNLELMKNLGADIAIDHRNDDFEKRLSGYDVVLNSLAPDILEKSISVLKPGGRLISISGPPDPGFARDIGASWLMRQMLGLLSFKIRRKAKKRGVHYSFLFMRTNGEQLSEITRLVDSGAIRPVVDRVFPFERTPDALARVEKGHGAGKVVIEVVESKAATLRRVGGDARAAPH